MRVRRRAGRQGRTTQADTQRPVHWADPSAVGSTQCTGRYGLYVALWHRHSPALRSPTLPAAVVSDSRGRPHTIRRAVCMKEEDAGMAWKHYEYRNGGWAAMMVVLC